MLCRPFRAKNYFYPPTQGDASDGRWPWAGFSLPRWGGTAKLRRQKHASGWLLQVRLPFELNVSNLPVGELFLKTLQQLFFVKPCQFAEHCGIADADL